ncbi:MAG: nucleotidyltransferase domain-containing protein [Arcobacter sp.]|nr:nucleotidyltransferase domain-containing protein [Arcobacter sp.]
MQVDKNSILEYLSFLKNDLSSKGIINLALFGSYAKDEQGVYSDIDIAIKKDIKILEKNGVYFYFEILNDIKEKIQKKFHRNVDIFDLDSTSELKENITKELIYV